MLFATQRVVFAISALSANGAWVAPPPTWLLYAPKLPQSSFHEIDPSKFHAAVSLLKNAPAVPLSAREANAFLANPLNCPSKSSPYLVRATLGFRATGSFSVQQSEDGLLVSHGSLGHSTPPPQNTALVVCLTSTPKAVYGSLSVAE